MWRKLKGSMVRRDTDFGGCLFCDAIRELTSLSERRRD